MVSTEAKLDKEKAERKDVDGKFKTRFEDIEANFEDMKVQLKKEIEGRSNDSALKKMNTTGNLQRFQQN